MLAGAPGDLNAAKQKLEIVLTDRINVTMEWKTPQRTLTEKTIGYTAHTPPPAIARVNITWK